MLTTAKRPYSILPIPPPPSPTTLHPPFMPLPPRQPPDYSLDTPGTFQPQGLCTYRPYCQECSDFTFLCLGLLIHSNGVRVALASQG